MKYLIGIDGGGSSSRCAIADINGKVLYSCNGGPTNFLRFPLNDVCDTIIRQIVECIYNLKIRIEDLQAVVIGTAGAGRKKDALFLENELMSKLKSLNYSVKNLKVVDDVTIALEGAFNGDPGAILISGTGSIIYGKNESGEFFRLGGYGNKIGDEGSGYSIGRKGLNAISKDFDKRGEGTLLTEIIRNKFNIESGQQLISKIYNENFEIASFAPFVFDAAEKNDTTAIKILNEECEELLLHIVTMKKLSGAENMKLALVGSNLSNDNFFSRLLKNEIREKLTGVGLTNPENPPEVGAILIAKLIEIP